MRMFFSGFCFPVRPGFASRISSSKSGKGASHTWPAPASRIQCIAYKKRRFVALSDGPVGVDVEKVRQTDLGIAPEIFSENELSWLNSEKTGRERRFFEIWTKKEARLKYDGGGLPDNLRAVDVTACSAPKLRSVLYMMNIIVSVCSAARFTERDVCRLTEAELYDMWRHCAANSDFYGECL